MTSQKTRLPLHHAVPIALDIVNKLSQYCERIAVAGSIRREVAFVGDIEIVCIPHMTTNRKLTFTEKLPDVSTLEYIDLEYLLDGRIIKNGTKYKQIYLEDWQINLDLFIVTPPAQWGVIYAIRTGSREFSKQLVTIKQQGGLLPSNRKIMNGYLCIRDNDQTIIDTPEEKDLFDTIGLEWVEPADR